MGLSKDPYDPRQQRNRYYRLLFLLELLLLTASTIRASTSSVMIVKQPESSPVIPNLTVVETVATWWSLSGKQDILEDKTKETYQILTQTTDYMRQQQKLNRAIQNECKALHRLCSYWTAMGMYQKSRVSIMAFSYSSFLYSSLTWPTKSHRLHFPRRMSIDEFVIYGIRLCTDVPYVRYLLDE